MDTNSDKDNNYKNFKNFESETGRTYKTDKTNDETNDKIDNDKIDNDKIDNDKTNYDCSLNYLSDLNDAMNDINYSDSKNENNIDVNQKQNINSELKLAKFINSTQKLWHGYPADHVKNNQDRPTLDILTKMHTNGLITTKQMRKISKGQKV